MSITSYSLFSAAILTLSKLNSTAQQRYHDTFKLLFYRRNNPATMAQPQDIPRGRVSRDIQPFSISGPSTALTAAGSSVQPGTSAASHRLQHGLLSVDTFSPSPMNSQNGSYEFDRVLKSGFVHKRTRKTKSWKPIYLVLRPTSLSIYKDQRETKLRHKVLLQDLTAVAILKDPKGKRDNLFGLFAPSRNYHLQAGTQKDADEWVELIRKEARIEEEEEEMFLASPAANATNYAGLDAAMQRQMANTQIIDDRAFSSSPEPLDPVGRPLPKANARAAPSGDPSMGVFRRPSHFDYSGNEPASQDESEGEAPGVQRTAHAGFRPGSIPENAPAPRHSTQQPRPSFAGRNPSQLSGLAAPASPELDQERVVWQGHLLYLKSHRGVRRWSPLWGVLRPKSFALYKDEDEYATVLLIQMGNVVNAVEIDAVSRTKRHCLQVITEEKSYRFCVDAEEMLDRCLGGFKSVLARRNDERRKAALDMPPPPAGSL